MERLQKYMARCGVASRRKGEELIRAGVVKVNGELVKEPGRCVDPTHDQVTLQGVLIKPEEHPVYLLLNKPKGIISTAKDTHQRETVLDLIPKALGRLYPVGRLDAETTGLLLLTNDGELTYQLTHPKYEFKKGYLITLKGQLSKEAIDKLRKGILLEDGLTAPARVRVGNEKNGKTTVIVEIHEGRNRQVRRMFQAVGYPQIELVRITYGFLSLGDMKPGEHRFLTKDEVKRLKRSVGLEQKGSRSK